MTNKWSLEQALWYCVVGFITFLLLGSFITSGAVIDLIYLVMFYSFLLVGHFIK